MGIEYSTVWNTKRGSQSYLEERIRRRQIKVTRRRRGIVKRRGNNLSSISSLIVLHSLEHPGRDTELSREEKLEG